MHFYEQICEQLVRLFTDSLSCYSCKRLYSSKHCTHSLCMTVHFVTVLSAYPSLCTIRYHMHNPCGRSFHLNHQIYGYSDFTLNKHSCCSQNFVRHNNVSLCHLTVSCNNQPNRVGACSAKLTINQIKKSTNPYYKSSFVLNDKLKFTI